MKFYEFLALTTRRNELLNYLCAKNVIRRRIKCPRCENTVTYNNETSLIIHCTNHYYKQTKKHKRKRMICNFKISILNGTWFSHALLDISTICRIICYVMMMNSPRQMFIQRELDISAHTAVDWINFCREVGALCDRNNRGSKKSSLII